MGALSPGQKKYNKTFLNDPCLLHDGGQAVLTPRQEGPVYSHFTTSYGSVVDSYLINSSSPTVSSRVIILHRTASFSSPHYSTSHIPSHYCASLSYPLPMLRLSFNVSFVSFSPSIILPASLPFASFQLPTSPQLLVMCCSFNSHCVV